MSVETNDIGALPNMSRSELLSLWEQLFENEPPGGLSRPMMVRILAYEMQARERGGLSQQTQRRLASVAVDHAPTDRGAKRLIPGGRLVREWNGRTHIVDVMEDHVTYQGIRYTSLSAVARRITGARWSGPRFFGLAGGK